MAWPGVERLFKGGAHAYLARCRMQRQANEMANHMADARTGATTKPIDLYYWPTPNGWKITIMLEECGLPYEVRLVNIGKGDQFQPEFLAISPNNRMPAIVDHDGPDGRPISVFESGAILQYLGRKTGKFYPSDERGRVEVERMADVADGRAWTDARPEQPFPLLCAREDPLCASSAMATRRIGCSA